MPVEYADSSGQIRPALRNFVVGGVALITLFMMIGFWLAQAGQAPWSDAGGYEQMLRGFLQTGKVDYMRWSQPTFLGILPVTVPWSLLFGTTTISLQWIGIVYGVALVAGMYLLLTTWVRPSVAFLLCACLFCFSEFALVVPTFMTDMPYGAYLVWFLVAHQKLATAYVTGSPKERPVALWVAWATLFLLASLTRSFTLVLVPLFVWQACQSRGTNSAQIGLGVASGHGQWTRTCLVLSVVMSVVCLVLVKLLTRNGFSPMELTALPEIVGRHEWKRFELRTLGVTLVQTALITLPALALCTGVQRERLRSGEIIVGAFGLFLAVWFTHKGLVTPLIMLPGYPGLTKLVGLAQLALAPVGFVLLGRVLAHAASRLDDGLTPVLLVIVAAHFFVLPIMQHPLLRHVLPAYLVLLLLVARVGARPGRSALALAACGVALVGGYNIFTAHAARTVAAVEWQFASDLRQSGVPLDQIDGGWNWFCAYHLRPGQYDTTGYVARYKLLQDTARYVVTDNALFWPNAHIVREDAMNGANGKTQIRLVDRAPAPSAVHSAPENGGTR